MNFPPYRLWEPLRSSTREGATFTAALTINQSQSAALYWRIKGHRSPTPSRLRWNLPICTEHKVQQRQREESLVWQVLTWWWHKEEEKVRGLPSRNVTKNLYLQITNETTELPSSKPQRLQISINGRSRVSPRCPPTQRRAIFIRMLLTSQQRLAALTLWLPRQKKSLWGFFSLDCCGKEAHEEFVILKLFVQQDSLYKWTLQLPEVKN